MDVNVGVQPERAIPENNPLANLGVSAQGESTSISGVTADDYIGTWKAIFCLSHKIAKPVLIL